MDVLNQEISRDMWIGAVAAAEIAAGKPITEIETVALEALESVLNIELQDRSRREQEQVNYDDLPF